MNLALQMTTATVPQLELVQSEIPTISQLAASDFPRGAYRWRFIEEEFVATLDARAWRADGRLGCYFTSEKGRVQLSLEPGPYGACRPRSSTIDFAGPDGRPGGRFDLKVSCIGRRGVATWIDARKRDAALEPVPNQCPIRTAEHVVTASHAVDSVPGVASEPDAVEQVAAHATAGPVGFDEPQTAEEAVPAVLPTSAAIVEELIACEIDYCRYPVKDYHRPDRGPSQLTARLDFRVNATGAPLACYFTTREGWQIVLDHCEHALVRDAGSNAFDLGSDSVAPGDTFVLAIDYTPTHARIVRARRTDTYPDVSGDPDAERQACAKPGERESARHAEPRPRFRTRAYADRLRPARKSIRARRTHRSTY